MVRRVDEAGLNRAIAWLFYYLGVNDGMSASLETLKTLNPEPLKDAEWRLRLRSYLPPKLAALRQPHADQKSAARKIEEEFVRTLQKNKAANANAKAQGTPEGLMDRDLQAVWKWTAYAKMMCPLSAERPQPAP